MASTPAQAIPRDIEPTKVDNPDVPAGAFQRAQSGVLQARDFNRAGRVWTETYPHLSVRRTDDMKLLSRLRWFRARSKFFWADHPLMPGSGLPINGVGRENLIRDAAMDTEDGATGVVLSFDDFIQETGWTFTVNGAEGAQEFVADGTGANGDRGEVAQIVLRVFPGDEILASVDGWLSGAAVDIEGRIGLQFVDADDANIAGTPTTTWTGTSSGTRRVVTATAPDDAAYVRLRVGGILTAAGGSGSVFTRDARLLRASSDPTPWSNPHVDGGAQTGSTLATVGWPASTSNVLRAGDVFRVGGSGALKLDAETDEILRSFEVLADVDSDASGLATIPIDPPIFSGLSLPDGAALRFEGMRLRVGMPQANLPQSSTMVDKYAGVSVTLVEALKP